MKLIILRKRDRLLDSHRYEADQRRWQSYNECRERADPLVPRCVIKIAKGNIEIGAPKNILLKAITVQKMSRGSYDREKNKLIAHGLFSERVRIIDSNSQPIKNVPYFIETREGDVYKGFTDSNGFCVRVFTKNKEKLKIYSGIHALEKW